MSVYEDGRVNSKMIRNCDRDWMQGILRDLGKGVCYTYGERSRELKEYVEPPWANPACVGLKRDRISVVEKCRALRGSVFPAWEVLCALVCEGDGAVELSGGACLRVLW